jgi:uncharacterized protein with beta-barrel porin domain
MTKNKLLSKRLACLLTTALIASPVLLSNSIANAAALTLSGNSTSGTNGINTNATLANGDTVTMSTFSLGVTSTTDALPFLTLGAITSSTGALSLLTTATSSNTSLTVDSFVATGAANVLVSITGTSDKTQTVNFTGNLTTTGTLGVTADAGDAAGTSRLNIRGNLTAGATTLTPGASTATLAFDGSSAQTVTAVINGNAADKGTVIAANTSGGVTFASAIGTTNTVSAINVTTGTATFNGAIAAVASTITGTATTNAAVTIPTITVATTGELTLNTAKTTATTLVQELNGTVNLNFAAALADTNAITTYTAGNGSSLVLGKTVTNGLVAMNTTNQTAATIHTGAKIFVPANLTNGQTIILFDDSDGAGAVSARVTAVLQNNALSTYTAAGDEIVTITSTDKSASTTASELGVNTNKATGLLQARNAAAAGVTADGAAVDAIFNVLNGRSSQSATADTAFTNQVAPQTDTITGSTVAAKAVTSGVQNVISTRLASLRSGDAYSTGVVTGSGMSANSGFVQAFGSKVEQKNKGNEFGYDADTTGFALGFDGKIDGGAVIGISYARSEADVAGKGTAKAKNDIKTDSVSLYADYATKDGYVEGSITYGKSDNKGSRVIDTGGLNRTYASNYDSEQYSFRLFGGIPQSLGGGAFFTPFAGATISQIKADAYTETSTTANDSLRLSVAQDTFDSQVGTIGIKYHQAIKDGKTTFTPEVKLALNNEFGDGNITTTNTYQGGGASFKNSTAIERTSATAGVGLNISSDNVSFNIGYEADVREKYLGHSAQAKITAKF